MTPMPPPPEVEIVVVEAPRLPPLPGEAAFAVQVLETEALRRTPRLDEALRRTPGVSLFRRTGSDAANPTIQGLSLRGIAPSGAGRALVTLDGVPQNDPFGGWVIWSALPPEGLERARIVRGAGAGPYGAGALTGVVALEERPATGGLLALDLSAGERDYARAAAAGGAPGLLVSASASTSGGYVPVRAGRGPVDEETTLSDAALAARVHGSVADVPAALRLFLYEERRDGGVSGTGSSASGGGASFSLVQTPLIGEGGWRLQAWIRSSDLENRFVAIEPDRSATRPANHQYATPALGYGFNAAWRRRGEAWSWEVGADARFTDGQSKERFRNLGAGFTRGREAGGRTAVAGLYAEGATTRGDLVLIGGVRADAWRASDGLRRERDLATGQTLLEVRAPETSGVTPTGRLAARLPLRDGVDLRGAAYAGFRPPTLNELHRPFRVGNDITEANPQLRPETLYGIEAGLVGEGRVSWSATLFHNRLEDPIANVTIASGPGVFPIAGFVPAGGVLRQRQNAGRIDATGLEFDAAADLSPRVGLRAAFTVVEARVEGGATTPQLTGLRPAQTAEITATAGAVWRTSERLLLSADARFEGERFEDDLNTRRLAPALTVDLRAAWRISADSELYLAADNLFDAEVEVAETATGLESFAAPRTVRVGFSLRR